VTALYLYDDRVAREFAPFALTRPVSELRVGAELTRRRWETALGMRAAGFVAAPHLDRFAEFDAPPAVRGTVPAGSVVANSRCIPRLAPVSTAGDVDIRLWLCEGATAALRIDREMGTDDVAAAFAESGETREGRDTAAIAGRWLDEVWALVRDLPPQLCEDVALLAPRLTLQSAEALRGVAHVIGPAELVHVEDGALIEPYTVFDTTAGPVLIRRGATVHAFTRVVGPCYVGEGATVAADRIGACSIGERARVHGEISMSVVLGHANKSHDGFVGHSYLGRWVNLGAGTTTSNMKNTYGTVALWTPAGIRDTGLQFMGTLFGDHAKTGIGLRLTTGSVIGAGANVYGSEMPPKFVRPFAWGEGDAMGEYRLDKFLDVAGRAMARRDVALGGDGRAQLSAAYAARSRQS